MKVGIVGFGSFGQFMAKHLKQKSEVFVTDIVDKRKEAEKIGVKFDKLEKVAKCDVVILSVPIEKLEKVLDLIKNKLRKGTLVLDVCSVKMIPCKLMKEILPNEVEIIGTHPMFGPQSARDSIKGMKIALINVNSKKINEMKKFCENLGLVVMEMTAEEHDKAMAYSQALTHFIGRTVENMDIEKTKITTRTFDDLIDIVNIIKDDSNVLFQNIETMNPFAKDIRKRFIEESKKLDDSLNKN